MKHTSILLFFLFFVAPYYNQAQTAQKQQTVNLIQVSGVVLDQDSLMPIPYVSVHVRNSQRAAVSDIYGFFTIVVYPGDVLQFSSMTHKPRSYQINDTTGQKYLSIIQVLTKDTVELPMVDIYSWPSKEDFKKAFLSLDLNDTDTERADKNLARDEMTYLERNTMANGSENYKYVMQTYYTKVYTHGQAPQMTIMDPIKWAQFISAWKQGKFKSTPVKKK